MHNLLHLADKVINTYYERLTVPCETSTQLLAPLFRLSDERFFKQRPPKVVAAKRIYLLLAAGDSGVDNSASYQSIMMISL